MENKRFKQRDQLIKEMFKLFEENEAGPLEVIAITSLFAGGVAASLCMKKAFFLDICEHAYDTEQKHGSRVLQ